MGRITSNIGLISGLPITDTVDQLIDVAARPRKLLEARTKDIQNQQVAVNRLSASLLSVQFDLGKLETSTTFASKKATSADPSLVGVSIPSGGNPVAASYQFTPVRQASSQQFISQRFDSPTSTFTQQALSFRTGGFVAKGIALDELNAGEGVSRGKIRVTDKSGDDAVIDLSYAITVDDVLEAINSNTSINVTAEVVGDQIQLTDNTGQTGTLSVKEIGSGSTAAGLGLSGINASGATTTALGTDIFSLHGDTRLSFLNDGNGVSITDHATSVDDLAITLADGTSAGVNLSGAKTISEVIDAINEDSQFAGKVSATIAADGKRLQITDLTTGSGVLTVSNGVLGTAADDLGLTKSASAGVIAGRRIVSGLKDTLLTSLHGGAGIEHPGNLNFTNRNGVVSVVNLSSAETVSEVISAINAQATGVTASLNQSGGGFVVTDTTGGTASNFIIGSSVGSTVAQDLKIAQNSASTTVDSGSLDRQSLSEATLLSSINGGRGITTLGDITITDTDGVKKTIDLNSTDSVAQTVGDVIDAINASIVGVTARINDLGDGIILIDTAGGEGKITVANSSGTTASDLGIAGTSSEVDVDGTPTQVLNGTTLKSLEIEDNDTLEDVVEKINELGGGVTASLLNDGQGYRLSLTVDQTGEASELLLDLQDSSFSFEEISSAQDAILQFGSASSAQGGIIVSSSDNTFDQVVDGLSITVEGTSDAPVKVTVSKNDAPLIAGVESFIKSYNALRDGLTDLTSFDAEALTTGLLFGTNEALRIDSDLSRAITDRYFGLGSFQSLEQIGISVTDKGKLELDKAVFQEAYADDPEGLENFFTAKDKGVVAKLNQVVERLAGEGGLLESRNDSLQNKIEVNQDKIGRLNLFLERQRERLLLQFTQLESVLAGLKESQAALAGFTPIAPLTTTRTR